MAKTGTCYFDYSGKPHATAEDAVIADIAAVIGGRSDAASMAPGLAKTILANRAEIEKAFADLDAMTALQTVETA